MTLGIAMVVVGLGLLVVAADRLVVSATRLSIALHLSPILIGAVVIGVGTSTPELVVTVLAAARPDGLDLALGNLVGSNIANLTLVLGIGVLVSPFGGQATTIRREGMVVLAAALLLTAVGLNGNLAFAEGWILAAALVVALGLLVRWGRTDAAAERDLLLLGGDRSYRVGREATIGVGTLILVVAGSQLLVSGAERVASGLGVTEAVIGLTLLAVGTSLPELATAVAAARRGEADIILGSVLGSNIFNSLAAAGLAGLIQPGPFSGVFQVALVAMVVISAGAMLMVVTGDRLQRWEGVVLLGAYVVFLAVGL